jgi:hypothetical protein
MPSLLFDKPIKETVDIRLFRVRLKLRFRREKYVILNQIAKNGPFRNCVFKKLRFENAEKCLFKSQAMWCFFENVVF